MKEEIDKFIIQRVKEIRTVKNVSQRLLDFELGFQSTFIAKAENSESPAHYNIEQLNEIARVLGCKMADFMPDTYIPPRHPREPKPRREKKPVDNKPASVTKKSPVNSKASKNK